MGESWITKKADESWEKCPFFYNLGMWIAGFERARRESFKHVSEWMQDDSIDPKNLEKILEVKSQTGLNFPLDVKFYPNSTIYTFDNLLGYVKVSKEEAAKQNVEAGKNRIEVIQSDDYKIPYEDNTFDLTNYYFNISSELSKEASRVTKPQAPIIIVATLKSPSLLCPYFQKIMQFLENFSSHPVRSIGEVLEGSGLKLDRQYYTSYTAKLFQTYICINDK